jgi:hypothetical protein
MKVAAGDYIEFQLFVVPGIVCAQPVMPGRSGKGDGVAEEEFSFAFPVECNDNLSSLDVFARIARNGDLSGAA